MKRAFSLILVLSLLLSCSLCLTACSEKKSQEYPVTYGDITIEQEPQAIVVLSDSAADIISYIGYDYKTVGRAVTCDQDFLSIVPSVGTADNPDVSDIIAKETDLVIADSSLSGNALASLADAGITVLTFDTPTDTDMLREQYGDLGMILGGKTSGRAKGEKAYDELFELLEQFRTAATDVVKTAAYLYMDQNGQLCTFTKGSLEQQVFGYNSAANIFLNQETPAVDSLQLRVGSPTAIFCDDDSVPDYLRNDESLSTLAALKLGRFYRIPLTHFYRYGVTLEQTVYEMIDFLNNLPEPVEESTPDEATPDEYDTSGDSGSDYPYDYEYEYTY